jgi:hypothetical protein
LYESKKAQATEEGIFQLWEVVLFIMNISTETEEDCID